MINRVEKLGKIVDMELLVKPDTFSDIVQGKSVALFRTMELVNYNALFNEYQHLYGIGADKYCYQHVYNLFTKGKYHLQMKFSYVHICLIWESTCSNPFVIYN